MSFIKVIDVTQGVIQLNTDHILYARVNNDDTLSCRLIDGSDLNIKRNADIDVELKIVKQGRPKGTLGK